MIYVQGHVFDNISKLPSCTGSNMVEISLSSFNLFSFSLIFNSHFIVVNVIVDLKPALGTLYEAGFSTFQK